MQGHRDLTSGLFAPKEALLGWGLEAKAIVRLQQFSYPGIHLRLDRDAQTRFWRHPPGTAFCEEFLKLNWKNFLGHIPPGNDSPPASNVLRDDDPRPDDTLYHLYIPGIRANYNPSGSAYRARGNFRVFGAVQLEDGRWVRSSPITSYWVGTSWKQVPIEGLVGNDIAWTQSFDFPLDNQLRLLERGETGPVSCDLLPVPGVQ